MSDVRTVIFDLGGVLIDWDPRHLYRQMFKGDEPGMERFLAEICNPAWNLALDGGKSFAEAVAELITKHPDQRLRIEAYRQRWIEMIGGPIGGTVELLDELSQRGVPLYAITNWSAETFPLVRDQPAYAFLKHFRTIFVSGELKMIKPHPEIFAHALERIGCPAGACLFIDDAAKNIEAARLAGLLAHHFTSPKNLADDLRAHGLIG